MIEGVLSKAATQVFEHDRRKQHKHKLCCHASLSFLLKHHKPKSVND